MKYKQGDILKCVIGFAFRNPHTGRMIQSLPGSLWWVDRTHGTNSTLTPEQVSVTRKGQPMGTGFLFSIDDARKHFETLQ